MKQLKTSTNNDLAKTPKQLKISLCILKKREALNQLISCRKSRTKPARFLKVLKIVKVVFEEKTQAQAQGAPRPRLDGSILVGRQTVDGRTKADKVRRNSTGQRDMPTTLSIDLANGLVYC